MPRVPSVGLSPTSRPQFQAPGVVAFQGGPELQQIARGGARLERIGRIVGQIGIEVEDKVNDARAMEATNTFENGVAQAFLEYQQLKGKDGVDGYENFQKQVEELRDGAGSLLMNDMQRASAMPIFDKINSRFSLRAQEHYMGAAAEYKQQQVVAERIKLEDALRSEPLGANSVALFMRLRQNLAKEAEGLGYSEERLDTHVLEGTSKLVNDLFNHYADSDRPEDALAFLKAVEVFEQSPMASKQGPTSLRGKTYAEAQAAAKADQTPVGAVMFDSTRSALQKKAQKLGMDTWAMRTVDSYKSASEAYEDSQSKFASGEWTASQREAVEKRTASVFDRKQTLSIRNANETEENARSEYLNNGEISQDTRDALDRVHKLDDFVGWARQFNRGQTTVDGDPDKWAAFQIHWDNDSGVKKKAAAIRTRKDLGAVFLEAKGNGASRDEALAWTKRVANASNLGVTVDVNAELRDQGIGTVEDRQQYATRWFSGQWDPLIQKAKEDADSKSSKSILALKSSRQSQFAEAFNKKVRELAALDTGLQGEKLLERARREAWEDGIRTYEVGGETRKINTWTALPSEIEAATIAASPAGTLSTLEGYATTKRIVGEPDDPKRQQTILEAATEKFVEQNMPAAMVAQYDQKRADLARNTYAALRMMGVQQMFSGAMATAASAQAFPPMPQRAALDIDSPAGQFRLLQIAQQIQLEDTASLKDGEKQQQLKRELWSAINQDIEIDGWLTEAREDYFKGRRFLTDPGAVSFLEDRYRNEGGRARNIWRTRGLTDESFEEVLRLHPTFATARSGSPTFTLNRKQYWTAQPFPEEMQPESSEVGR